MSVNAILACDDNWGIGKDNDLPWPRNDYDMKWFRENTTGGVVVMGRKTWESIGSKQLPNRVNIVVTSQGHTYDDPKTRPTATWSGSMIDCINYLRAMHRGRKIWMIGGANIYKQTVPLCDHVYLTRIEGDYNCDAFFDPKLLSGFVCLTSTKKAPGCTFSIWSKI